MEDKSLEEPPKSRLKTVFLFIVLLIIAAAVWFAIDPGTSNNAKRPNTSRETQTRSPDKVKSSDGPNYDTTPSDTGTGPGSNNSLLGPNP